MTKNVSHLAKLDKFFHADEYESVASIESLVSQMIFPNPLKTFSQQYQAKDVKRKNFIYIKACL